jgi:hemerythrin superfamily protein
MTTVAGDVVDVLLTQHALLEQQFRTVAAATRKPERKAAFEELARLLTVHETIEQELVHPQAAGDTEPEVVAERIEEEQRADEVLAELFEIEVNDPDFPRLLQGLKESVLAHATREERYEFPRLRHAEPPERLRALADAVVEAFEAAPAKLPPADDPVIALATVREQVLEAIRAS